MLLLRSRQGFHSKSGWWEWFFPPPRFYSLAGLVRWVSMQHLNPETPFNLRCREAEPFWIVGFHNCQAASTPPLPPENRESWEFNYDGILALDPAGLRRCLMGEPSFRTKRHPVFTQELRTHSLPALCTVCPSSDTRSYAELRLPLVWR